MHALRELFSTDVGLLSLAGITFTIGMAVFFLVFFVRHIREDSQQQASTSPRG